MWILRGSTDVNARAEAGDGREYKYKWGGGGEVDKRERKHVGRNQDEKPNLHHKNRHHIYVTERVVSKGFNPRPGEYHWRIASSLAIQAAEAAT